MVAALEPGNVSLRPSASWTVPLAFFAGDTHLTPSYIVATFACLDLRALSTLSKEWSNSITGILPNLWAHLADCAFPILTARLPNLVQAEQGLRDPLPREYDYSADAERVFRKLLLGDTAFVLQAALREGGCLRASGRSYWL